MDYKEKYEQALDRAKEMYDAYRFSVDPSNFKPTDFEYIFPELKESDGEKIRKNCIHFLKLQKQHHAATFEIEECIAWLKKQGKEKNEEDTDFTIYYPLKNGKGKYECIPYSFYGSLTSFSEDKNLIDFLRNCFYSKEECEEWIKKQDEQKSSDKVEPKFKVGDWVVCEITGSVYQIKNCIENLRNHKYGYDLTNGGYIGSNGGNHYHLWTIKDAKDGDVLADEDNNIAIYKEINGIHWDSYIYLGCDNRLRGFSIGGSHIQNNTKPATKEQRDLLFAKMIEAGYDIFQSWDSEKLELRKIEQKSSDKVQENFKNSDSWQDKLANLNEKLAECSKYNVRILNTGDGLYMCNILDDGIEDEVYAENFYEDELYDLIDSVKNYLMNKINEQ